MEEERKEELKEDPKYEKVHVHVRPLTLLTEVLKVEIALISTY